MLLHEWVFCLFTFVSGKCNVGVSTMTVNEVAVDKDDSEVMGIMVSSPPGYHWAMYCARGNAQKNSHLGMMFSEFFGRVEGMTQSCP